MDIQSRGSGLQPLDREDYGRLRYDRWLFLMTVSDIRERINKSGPSRYELLGLSPLLRKLLSDGPDTLLPTVRAQFRRTRIRFECKPVEPQLDHVDEHGAQMTAILRPARAEFAERSESFNLDEFLKVPAAFYREQPVSVLEVIKYFAHVEGGVHRSRGEREEPYEKFLSSYPHQMPFTSRLHLEGLAAIARVTERALDALYNQVLATGANTLPYDQYQDSMSFGTGDLWWVGDNVPDLP
ncbi:MAG: hypothetical protein ACTIA6_09605 [Pseudoclavibacter sp.]